MPRLNQKSVDKLRDTVDTANRYSGRPPEVPISTPVINQPPALIGRIDSGPDSDGLWTGRLVKFDVYTRAWEVTSQWDVKFMRTNADDPAPSVGRRYPCRPSHVDVNEADRAADKYVYNLLSTSGSSQAFVVIDDNLGTGTHNVQGRSLGYVTLYSVGTDSWSIPGGLVLIEPLNTGQQFVEGIRYPAWYAGEATGGYDGTGTGTLGTGTGTAGGTLSVYIVEGDVLLDVLVNVECIAGEFIKTFETIRVRGLA
jgi:hypothetical protein